MKKLFLLTVLFFFINNAYSIQKHESNFILHTVHDSNNKELFDDDSREKSEVVYQLSFEHELVKDLILFSYTQKSFWQLYNEENSRQFRETNYNPKLFVRYDLSKQQFNFGYEHKSNGQTEPKSRSYDRIFVDSKIILGLFEVEFKKWIFLIEEQNSKNKKYRKESSQEMLGNFFIKLSANAGIVSGSVKVQRTNEFTAGNNEYEFFINFETFSIMFYHFEGLGDSLIDYNHNIKRTGIGASIGF